MTNMRYDIYSKVHIYRKVVDAITGNDLAAFGEKLRENVVFQVLE